MEVCYDALMNANKEEFQNKIKTGRWKRFFNKHIRSQVSITLFIIHLMNFFIIFLLIIIYLFFL